MIVDDSSVLIGVLSDRTEIPVSKLTSKVGGNPHWLISEPENYKDLKCEMCSANMTHILTQACPLDDEYERNLYVFICTKCGGFAKCWRQKVATSDIPQEELTDCVEENKEPELVGNQDRDDNHDQSDFQNQLQSFVKHMEAKNQQKQSNKDQKKKNYEQSYLPGYYLNIFEESSLSLSSAHEAELVNSIDEDNSVGDFEEERQEIESSIIEYNMRMDICPQQVYRYDRGKQPLLIEKVKYNVPRCPHCNGPRCFECQILPTVIYLLARKRTDWDFGPILVYTCENDCGGAGTFNEFCYVCPPA